MDNDLVTQAEIAQRYEVNKRAVGRWIQKKGWPRTYYVERSGHTRKAYKWEDVQSFCRLHGLPKRIVSDQV
jgi:uncharacterized protein YjcR